jgi:ABC-type lipoprotein release transport system permease subunit
VPLEVRMAWRNVWRNPRRTGLTLAATVFAVVLVMFSVAMAAGTHEKMIEDSVRVNAGHVQVSRPG